MSTYPRSYYAATANPAPAHPALAEEVSADACVIGGGYTGLSAALHLAQHGYKTVLLEAGFDELSGISWSKGCYMGQELTARTKYRALIRKRLQGMLKPKLRTVV